MYNNLKRKKMRNKNVKGYYSYWTDSRREGTKEHKLFVRSYYETTCREGKREFTAFICRMSNGMTFYTGKDWESAYLTWHMVRKGTDISKASDADMFNVNGKIDTMKRFIELITL